MRVILYERPHWSGWTQFIYWCHDMDKATKQETENYDLWFSWFFSFFVSFSFFTFMAKAVSFLSHVHFTQISKVVFASLKLILWRHQSVLCCSWMTVLEFDSTRQISSGLRIITSNPSMHDFYPQAFKESTSKGTSNPYTNNFAYSFIKLWQKETLTSKHLYR